jgi:hypothetical protein
MTNVPMVYYAVVTSVFVKLPSYAAVVPMLGFFLSFLHVVKELFYHLATSAQFRRRYGGPHGIWYLMVIVLVELMCGSFCGRMLFWVVSITST